MKPMVKKIIAISSAVIAALLVAVLILSLVTIRPIEDLGKYDHIYALEAYNRPLEKNEELLNKGLETVKFSVMRSILDGQSKYKIKPVTVKDKDGNDEQRSYSVEIFSDLRPRGGEYMLMLFFNEKQTHDRFTDNDGKKIVYDRIILIIPSAEDNIQDVRIFPYFTKSAENDNDSDIPDENDVIGSRYYYIYEFTAKMYVYELYETIKDFYPAGTSDIIA